jgi:ABC-type branched-subunit amino acid transport system substrate-binding protein
MTYRATAGRTAAVASLVALLAGCGGGSGSSGGGGGGTLVFGELMPFTGDQATEGGQVTNGCLPAVAVINKAGGVLGNQVTCQEFDTRGDAVDAVPAAEKMLATTSNLVGVLGPSTAEAPSTEPLLRQANMPMFSVAGDAQFDKSTDPYFYRFTPSDDLAAKALALEAKDLGFTRIAIVFTAGDSAQANVPPLQAVAPVLNLAVTDSLSITPNQASYRTEVAKLIADNPQVIINEGDAQSDATFFGEVKEAGANIPMVITAIATFGDWQNAVSTAMGTDVLAKLMTVVDPYAPTQGEGWQVFNDTLKGLHGNGVDYNQFNADIYSRTTYDACIAMALAMTAANSTDPKTYNPEIVNILTPGADKTTVHTYQEGLDALKAGKKIYLSGAGGDLGVNKYHNVTGAFETQHWDPSTKALVHFGVMSNQELAQLALG